MNEWFRDLRKAKQLSQHELATMAAVHCTYINKIELGIRRPSPEIAKRLSSILDFDWTRFYEDIPA